MLHRITVLPQKLNIEAAAGQSLMETLRSWECLINAPCGGNGTCGKCRVLANGQEVLACQTIIDRDMTVVLPRENEGVILTEGVSPETKAEEGVCLAVDIGTTTVAAYLLENGQLLAVESCKNPQGAFGADVVSRIHYAQKDSANALTNVIRKCLEDLTRVLLRRANRAHIDRICVVGNPAMQQLFMGLSVENLTQIPFRPILTKAEITDGGRFISVWSGAALYVVPDIAGYIGADTVACILSAGIHQSETLSLLVDIGTNGEMVLGNKDRLVACATAAGPALEGANIQFGMQAQSGAIDHVEKKFTCHIIGQDKATGICGSGLLDAVAVALDKGLINERGRILNESRTVALADGIFLTQEDIRQLQQAKGAIAAGIHLMAKQLQVSLEDIENVYLAGAFGTFMNPRSACRIGLIPPELEDRIICIGNAAGSGAQQMVCSKDIFADTDTIISKIEHLELAVSPDWAKSFARCMRFDSQAEYLCQKALSLGFSYAVTMDTQKLTAREDVRTMCAQDKCGAYGKNWTCPPYCGTPEECEKKMRSYTHGILVQTVCIMKKTIDSKAYRETEVQHLQQLYKLAEVVKADHPHALCLGSGGCRICEKCAFPEPCRFPEKACSSMEGYGLFVTQVCKDNTLPYHHGERTVTYTACILF